MTSGTIHGVDFSGSQSPGRDIWITTAAADDDQLRISSVEPAAESLEGTGREEILDSLQSFLRDADDAAIGLDFPFGFPQAPSTPTTGPPFSRTSRTGSTGSPSTPSRERTLPTAGRSAMSTTVTPDNRQ